MSKDVQISKFMSLVLRHAPEEAGIQLDANGWTNLDNLSAVIQSKFKVEHADVDRVIAENSKKRFVVDRGRIRAAQGHSVDVDLGLPPATPPDRLFHGTKAHVIDAIMNAGLLKQARQHVHLSSDVAEAAVVARRRSGENAILEIDAARMWRDGHAFFRSENGVWLTDHVPPTYLKPVVPAGAE
jgi:putative RNA 2'-phosphotransferase